MPSKSLAQILSSPLVGPKTVADFFADIKQMREVVSSSPKDDATARREGRVLEPFLLPVANYAVRTSFDPRARPRKST